MKSGLRIGCALVVVAACVNEPAGPSPRVLPTIDAVAVATNSYNVLSAIVGLHVRNVDSVVVRFRPADVAAAGDSATPSVATMSDSAVAVIVPMFGLLPSRRYILRTFAYGSGAVV